MNKYIQQNQTAKSFRDKWEQNKDLAFSETLREGSDIFNWILNRNGFANIDGFKDWLKGRHNILDAGCGNGRVTALLRKYSPSAVEITGIDLTSAEVARANLADHEKVTIRQMDLLGDLSDIGPFDLIYCQEVLHHTANPRASFLNLAGRLAENGEIAIYVYKIKSPLREYADDYIRNKVSTMPYDKAMITMRQLTELGRILHDVNQKITVPEIEVLGIESGEYDLQRFLYHFFLKCFWNPALNFEENAAINYDWYHPQISTRHTLEEVESWFVAASLDVIHRHVDHYGITIRGIRRH